MGFEKAKINIIGGITMKELRNGNRLEFHKNINVKGNNSEKIKKKRGGKGGRDDFVGTGYGSGWGQGR